VFRLLDAAKFHACFVAFVRRFALVSGAIVALDGKTLRRSFDRAASQSPLHLVSAGAAEQRLVLGQLAVDGKSNEITALPKLLAVLSLKGATLPPTRSTAARHRLADHRSGSDYCWR
jgi:hypothetical protein